MHDGAKTNKLTDVFPDVVLCWNYKKNGSLKPEDLSAGSNKKVWWKCSRCGREWQTTIYAKAKSGTTTCKECTFKQLDRSYYVKPGINDLASCNERVSAEWDYEKNGELKPENVPVRSITKVWWKCNKGHTWQASVLSRTKEGYRGCPICANKLIVAGINDLATTRPDLAKNWNYEKNGDLKPSDIAAGSNRKVWWKCEKGHEWEASLNNVSRGKRCPYCANLKVWPGFNDLASQYPDIVKMWNYKKNKDLLPSEVMPGSGKKVWWICNVCGYEWEASIVARTKGHGCPVCMNRVVIRGVNDLRTRNPELATEWNYKKNGSLTPEEIIAGSSKVVWWKCKNGHEWKTSVVSRNKGHFCPFCDAHKHTSLAEKAFVYYLKQNGVNVKENWKIGRRELDIFLPAINVAIEYDGQHFHTNLEKDKAKNDYCKKNNIHLIRIREPKLPNIRGCTCIKIRKLTSNLSYLVQPINELLSLLNIQPKSKVDPDKDLQKIYSLFQLGERKDSIAKTHPELTEEWDYEKNESSPEEISQGQHYKAWWICRNCGFSWEAQVYSRCAGSGCPNCAGTVGRKKPGKLIVGKNDLKTVRPDLAKEWDYSTNEAKPSQFTSGSNEKVNWICKHNHIYTASIANRVKGTGCPYCSGRKVLQGFNDLATKNPQLASEWNYKKNGNLKPQDFMAGSGKKVWWRCKNGHEWEATICSRNRGNGCPYCAGKKRKE